MNDPTLEAKETDDGGTDDLLGMPKRAFCQKQVLDSSFETNKCQVHHKAKDWKIWYFMLFYKMLYASQFHYWNFHLVGEGSVPHLVILFPLISSKDEIAKDKKRPQDHLC